MSVRPLPAEQPTLSTTRLVLRGFVASDAAQVQRLAGDAVVAETTLVIPHPYPDGAAEDWIAGHGQAWSSAKAAIWAITRRGDEALLGAMSLHLRPLHRQAVAGYWIGRPFWGQGIASEALAAVIACGFDALGLHRIEATHLARNPASGRVMEKAGMAFEGHFRDATCKNGRMEDVVMRARLASDAGPAKTTASH